MIDHTTEQLQGPWVGYADAAERSGLSEIWLRQLYMRGELSSVARKVGRRVLFSVPALDRWISNGGAATETAA